MNYAFTRIKIQMWPRNVSSVIISAFIHRRPPFKCVKAMSVYVWPLKVCLLSRADR